MQLSYSRLRTFGECALKYRYAYLERLPRPPIRALAGQRRLHAALAAFHRAARRDGQVAEEELLATWARLWGAETDPLVTTSKEYREGEEILRLYARTEGPKARVPAYLEHPLRVELGPWVLAGTVDRLDYAPSGGYSLVDYKLDRELPGHNEAATSRQLSFYDLLVSRTLGVAPDELRLHYLRHGQEQVSRRTPAQRQETLAWVEETAAGIRAERRWKPCEGQGCRTCPFWKACPAKTGRSHSLTPVWQQASLLDLAAEG